VTAKFSICVHVFETLCDPKDLIINALKSLVYQGMKPGRYPLGIMADANRGKFAWWDVTQEEINNSKKKTFNVVTGSYMTERERNVVYFNEKLSEFESQKGKVGEQHPMSFPTAATTHSGQQPGISDTLDEDQEDGTEWIRCVEKQTNYAAGNTMQRTNVLRIREDLDEWVLKRHLMNVGIPQGPHPLDENRMCWYYRPIITISALTAVCKHSSDYVEYRDYPTSYNQHMRAMYHLTVCTPEKIRNMIDRGYYVDPVQIKRMMNHYSWLYNKEDCGKMLELLKMHHVVQKQQDSGPGEVVQETTTVVDATTVATSSQPGSSFLVSQSTVAASKKRKYASQISAPVAQQQHSAPSFSPQSLTNNQQQQRKQQQHLESNKRRKVFPANNHMTQVDQLKF
jgi:hypothetical protein